MKRFYTLLLTTLCLSGTLMLNAQRYVTEEFTDVAVETDIIYGANTTVLPVLLGAAPSIRPLNLDLYTPAGDTETERPLIVMLHSGNFLPQFLNGSIIGTNTDPYVVNLAESLARRGYAVALADYRKGWNPSPTATQEEKINTLINASYRGIQDASSCARYFRKSVDLLGNPHGIDPDKITIWGIGTGAYVSLGAVTVDDYLDVVIPKFIGSDINGDGIPDPMVIPFINGDPKGLTVGVNPLTGDTLCFPNHAELDANMAPVYSSEFQLAVNMGGALGDTSWVDESDPPMIAYQVPTDPFAPYNEDILIVPTTGDLIVEVQGANLFIPKAVSLGNNDVFINDTNFDDDVTASANANNGGNEGLYPMVRPNWDLTDDGMDNPVPVEASPWEYWDVTQWSTAPLGQATLDGAGGPCEGIPMEFCNWHLISSGSNPDMSFEKASAYQDSIINYFAPRACVALDLPCKSAYLTTSTEDILVDVNLTISPNPTSDIVNVSVRNQEFTNVEIFNVAGKMMIIDQGSNRLSTKIDVSSMPSGVYIMKVYFDEGIATKQLVIE